MPHRSPKIDRDKLRTMLRKLGHEYVFYILDDAIELLPDAKLRKIVGQYIPLERLAPDEDSQASPGLLIAVTAFDTASRAGKYFESFRVNSQNYTKQSMGTTAWIAECRRLLDRCVADSTAAPIERRNAFDALFGLMDCINRGEDIVFFADEGGSWQVGVDWKEILPAWFKVLAATAEPEEFAERVPTVLDRHYRWGREEMIAIALKIATPAQRRALEGAAKNQARR